MNINELFFNAFWIVVYIVFLVFFVLGTINLLAAYKRAKYRKLSQYNLTFLKVRLPSQNEIEIDAAEHLFSSLVGFRRSFWKALFMGQHLLSFEIVAKADGIRFFVIIPDELANFVEKQISATYPEAEIDLVDPNEVWDRGTITEIAQLKLSGKAFNPIRTYKDMEKTDPLNLLTNSMSKLAEEDVIAVQYLLSPAGQNWQKAGYGFISHVKQKQSDPNKGHKVDASLLEGVEKKLAKPGFNISIRLVCIAQNEATAHTHLRGLATSFEQFADAKYNRFKFVQKKMNKRKQVDDFIYRRMRIREWFIPIFDIMLYRNQSILNIEEMASVFHFPNKNVQTPNIEWLGAKSSGAPTNLPTEGLYLGENVFRGVKTKVHIKEEDRVRHFYIIGQTGTGKSVFMSSLALQDIKNGHGVAYIDPHGSEITTLLEQIPRERVDDVILWDVSDVERPMGINLLEAHSEEEKHMTINAFIALLYKLYDPNRQGIMGPQLERAIRNVMLTAMVDPESTMVDVLRLLIDADYAQSFIPRIQDPLVKKFWTDEMAKTSDFHKSEKMGYFVSKFDRFVTERLMRNILGQPVSAINIPYVMANRKILLVDLSKGKIGEENSNFLGLLLVPKILAAALARATLIGKEEFPHFYLYVDEFQNFATPDFATILSEARKYKLNLSVAHQFVAQLDDQIKEAVFGNVGTMSVFRIGIDDAEYFEHQFEPVFTKNDLMNSPVGTAYMRLLIDGHPSPPFSLKTDWDMIKNTPRSKEISAHIREASRQKYGKPIAEVEEYINKRAGFLDEPEQPAEQVLDRRRIPF